MADGTTNVRAAASSSMAEGFIGLCAVALGIIAFANIVPNYLLSIGIIASGAAMVFEGGSIAGRYRRLEHISGGEIAKGGTATEFVLGAAAIALGALGLAGIAISYLIPIALIVLGAGLIFSGATNARLNAAEVRYMRRQRGTIPTAEGRTGPAASVEDIDALEMAREAEVFNVGIGSFAGLGIVTLGILALIGLVPMILCLVGLLGTGAVQFFNSAAAGSMLGFTK